MNRCSQWFQYIAAPDLKPVIPQGDWSLLVGNVEISICALGRVFTRKWKGHTETKHYWSWRPVLPVGGRCHVCPGLHKYSHRVALFSFCWRGQGQGFTYSGQVFTFISWLKILWTTFIVQAWNAYMQVVQFEVWISHEKTFSSHSELQADDNLAWHIPALAAGVSLTSFFPQGGMVFYG